MQNDNSLQLEKREQFAVSLRRNKTKQLIALRRSQRAVHELKQSKFIAEADSKCKWHISDLGKVGDITNILHK